MLASTSQSTAARAALRGTRLSSRVRASPISVARTTMAGFYEQTAKDAKGKEWKMSEFKGKVLLITNVASACGYTRGNYAELVDLYTKYQKDGLEVLAFPCNQFGAQESGSNEQICSFAEGKGAKFAIMDKIDVNGANTHPLWKYLKETAGGGDVKWNFDAKFIIDKQGNVVERNSASPAASEEKIKKLLAA